MAQQLLDISEDPHGIKIWITRNELIYELKRYIRDSGKLSIAADRLGISVSYLSDIMNNRKDISDNVAESLGFKKCVMFRRYGR